jgi:hypothetical protein
MSVFGFITKQRSKGVKMSMSKPEIETLISILETKLNQTEGALNRFIIWQEIKSLKQQLESLADQSPSL